MTDLAIMDDVAETNEGFAEKLSYAVRRWPGSQRELASKVGIKPQALSQYMSGSVPKPGTIYKLAKELDVGLNYLLDDGEPVSGRPPSFNPKAPLWSVGDHELMFEYARRYRRAALDIHRLLTDLEMKDRPWLQWAVNLWMIRFDAELDAQQWAKIDGVMYLFHHLDQMARWPDPSAFCEMHHDELPGSELDPDELTLKAFRERHQRIIEANPGYDAFTAWASTRNLWQRVKESRPAVEKQAKQVLAYLLCLPDAPTGGNYDKARKHLQGEGLIKRGKAVHGKPNYFMTDPVPVKRAKRAEDAEAQ